MALTPDVDSVPQQHPTTTTEASTSGESLLPGLKETVGSAYDVPRPLLPQPASTSSVPEFFIPGVSVIYIDDQPIRTYVVGGIKYNMAQPPNETMSEFSRYTVDGRRLTYRLNVVQQPEKARACGSGPRCRCMFIPYPVYLLTLLSQHLPTVDRSTHLQWWS
jgi:hypothetical protein